MALSDITTSLSGTLIAACDMDNIVSVWRSTDLKRILTLHASIDPLGGRLALLEDGSRVMVATGSWDRREVTAYELATGNTSWSRSGLTHVQQMSPAGDGSVIAVSFDRGPIQLLDAWTGATVAALRGGRSYWQSSIGPFGAVGETSRFAIVDSANWKVRWRVPIAGFAILAVAFSEDSVVFSDTVSSDRPAPSTVVSYSISGSQQWVYATRPGCNVPWLGRVERTGDWLGIEQDTYASDHAELLRVDTRGRVVMRVPVRAGLSFGFALGGRLLVASNGTVSDPATGSEVGVLES